MRKFLLTNKIILSLIVVMILFFPLIASAQLPMVNCGPGYETPCTLCHLFEMIGRIYAFANTVIISLIVLIVMFGGFTYLTSIGDPKRLELAMNIFKGAGIGLFIVLFAFVIISLIYGAVGARKPPGEKKDIWDICLNNHELMVSNDFTAPLAQLVEQEALNFKVGGSSPSRGTL